MNEGCITDIGDIDLKGVVIPVCTPVVEGDGVQENKQECKQENKEISKKVEYDEKTGVFTFMCPHCEHFVEVGRNEINCTIFRHGYFFNRVGDTIVLTIQMNPHTPKQECDRLFREGLIYGCGKPFRLSREGGEIIVEKCGYI